MRYALLIYGDESALAGASQEDLRAHVQGTVGWIKQAGRAVQGGDPLATTATATTVRVRQDETLITDGPFAETKEQLAGFFMVECGDLDEAIRLAASMPLAHTGSIEIRPVAEELASAVWAGAGH